MKRWTQIFKALANVNRLKIIKLLAGNHTMSVSDISVELKISLKATSKHLIILHNLNILDCHGHSGHVYYLLNRRVPKDIQRAMKLFL